MSEWKRNTGEQPPDTSGKYLFIVHASGPPLLESWPAEDLDWRLDRYSPIAYYMIDESNGRGYARPFFDKPHVYYKFFTPEGN